MSRLWIAGAVVLAVAHAEVTHGASSQVGSPDPKAQSSSLIALVANGSAYEGQLVDITGVLRIEFEGNSIYLTKEHFDRRVSDSALFLSLDRDMGQKLKHLTGKYVQVQGIFTAKTKGHMGMFAGTLNPVLFVRARK